MSITFCDFLAAMASSAHVIEGEISVGTQHHFYMETNVCISVVMARFRVDQSSKIWIIITFLKLSLI